MRGKGPFLAVATDKRVCKLLGYKPENVELTSVTTTAAKYDKHNGIELTSVEELELLICICLKSIRKSEEGRRESYVSK